MKISRIIWYTGTLTAPGGEERLLLEGVKFFKKKGIKTDVLTWKFNRKALFDGLYASLKDNIVVLEGENSGNIVHDNFAENVRHILRLFALRKRIREFNPDIIVTQTPFTPISLYLATLFMHTPYVVFIHGTSFRFSPYDFPYIGTLKYASVYKKHLIEIRNSVTSYRDTTPLEIENFGILSRAKLEIRGILSYLAIRKARRIFVLSFQNKWEVKKLYGKDSIVLKGAFPVSIFDYKPMRDVKKLLGLKDKKMILSISRLAPNKRIDLCIKSFALVAKEVEDSVLVIGGTGPEEEKLKKLVKELNIGQRVLFIGFVKEKELWDYYASCDVFINLDIADFDIASYVALGVGRKLVCTTEFEIDRDLSKNRFIFVAEPNEYAIATSLKEALNAKIGLLSHDEKDLLKKYTWDEYFNNILNEIASI